MDEHILNQIIPIVVKEVMKELKKHPIQFNDIEDDEDDEYYE